MIIIKDEETLNTVLYAYDPMLVRLVLFVYAYEGKVVITCGFREGDEGVHGTVPCRGIDIRSWIYKDPQKLVDLINKKWSYDHERPEKVCAMLHGKHPHIHLQVHSNTEIIG